MFKWIKENKWQYLSVILCTLSVFLLLYIFRGYDDNRLTSWRWAFAGVNVAWFIPLVIVGHAALFYLFEMPASRKYSLSLTFILSFSAAALFWSVPEVIVDSSRYFTQAKHLEVHGINYFFSEWGRGINAWTDLPLIPFLYGIVFTLFGEGREYIQTFNTLLFSMTAVLTYLTGKVLWDKETGLLGGVLLLGVPYIYSQVPLMLVDVPTMFFLTLSVYTFLMALERGRWWIVFSSFALYCSFFSKYSAWLMLTVLGVAALVSLFQDWRESGKAKAGNALGRALSVLFIASLFIGLSVFVKFEVISEQVLFLREYQAPGLRRWGESFASTFLYQVHPFITVSAFYAVYRAFRKKDFKFLIICWLLLLVVALDIRRSRYVLVTFPMVTLMASYGLQAINSEKMRSLLVSCAVSVSLAVAVFAYMPFLNKMSLANLSHTGSYLDSLDADYVEVVTVPAESSVVNSPVAVPILDLFTDKSIIYENDENYSIPFETIEKSPLRFTWEYINPDYYAREPGRHGRSPVIVVISNNDDQTLPERIKDRVSSYRVAESYKESTGQFRYSPVVSVYLPHTQ